LIDESGGATCFPFLGAGDLDFFFDGDLDLEEEVEEDRLLEAGEEDRPRVVFLGDEVFHFF